MLAATPKSGRRLRMQVGGWLIAGATLPVLLMAGIYLQREWVHTRQLRETRMQAAADTAAAALEQFVLMHRSAIEYIALDLGQRDRTDLNQDLEALRSRFSGFLTLLRTTADAEIVAVATAADVARDQQLAERGARVADRSYFRVPRDQRVSFVSEVFRGRGLGSDLIVAISAPIITGDRFAGVVQGALRLQAFDSLTHHLKLHGEQLSLDVVDQTGQVVYSVGAAPLPLLQPAPALAAGAAEVDAHIPALGWTVCVRLPAEAVSAANFPLYFGLLLALLASSGVVLLALLRLNRRLVMPLENIQRGLDGLDLDGAIDPQLLRPLPRHTALEVRAMHTALAELIDRLVHVRSAWSVALVERDQSSAALEAVLAERDAHIEQQTIALRKALHEARAANLVKDQLLANTSHEIRTPLNGIIGSAELLLPTLPEGPQRRRMETLLRSAESLLSLLNDLLDLARIRQGASPVVRVPFELRREVDTVIASLAALANRQNIDLIESYENRLPLWVEGDPQRLRQVLLNLTGNALKFIERGQVTLEVSRTEVEGLLRFAVTDTGIGLSTDAQARIFEPFFRVETTGQDIKGTGLGLSIARELVHTMGGSLKVQSQLGVGSRFYFDLPLPEVSAPAARATQGSTEGPELPFLRVLVVDDVDVNREVAVAQLETLGQRAEAVDSGAAALALLARKSCDLVLLDCQMPGMDGYETARRIRALPITQPRIIALTANAQDSERDRCLAAGMDDYLSKPLRMAELRRTLASLENRPKAGA